MKLTFPRHKYIFGKKNRLFYILHPDSCCSLVYIVMLYNEEINMCLGGLKMRLIPAEENHGGRNRGERTRLMPEQEASHRRGHFQRPFSSHYLQQHIYSYS